MRLIRGQPRSGVAATAQRHCVLTIGTFDGLHVGHQALIARARELAAELGVAAGLLSFEPMPREFFHPNEPPARLTNFRERWRVLQASGLHFFHVLPFNADLRALSGRQFMALLRSLGAKVIIVGHDFRFAKGGEASAQWCAIEAKDFGFQVEIVPPVRVAGERASSGLVRGALEAGDLARAAQFLGRPFTLRGRARRGAQLGRTLGYPTANIALHRRRSPVAGIFAVRVRGARLAGTLGAMIGPGGIAESRPWPAVASLGTRPTVNGVEPLLEVHVFDFDGDLYGAELEVEFVAFLRPEQRFESLDAMVDQIHRDAAEARAILARTDAGVPGQ